jgi:histidinol dehydrogenase
MKLYTKRKLSAEELQKLLKRPGDGNESITTIVRNICNDVKKRGDEAVREYGDLYEPTAVDVFRVTDEEFEEAEKMVSPNLHEAITVAERNIRKFHEAQVRSSKEIQISEGIVCRREIRPYDTVGLYIPAGSAPLPSTVLMLGVPAKLAGCRRIVLCSPPNASGRVDPAVLVTASRIGIREVYIAGGAQAIAAMAYGTKSIPKVDKIFGPGSRYVTIAKQIISADPDKAGCPVDLIAGPSELLIIADSSADEHFVVADLLSQAEHDPFSQVVLVTTEAKLAEKVIIGIEQKAAELPRRKIIEQSLSRSFCLVVSSLDEALDFTNQYAPEHLSIFTEDPDAVSPMIKHAGSVFLGSWSPVTAGDYASGTNHTLPTGGSAKWFGGLTVESFQKSITFQKLSEEGLRSIAPTLVTLTEAEGLEAHKQSVTERLK